MGQWVNFTAAAAIMSAPAGAQPNATAAAKVDAVFAAYDKPDAPGCAVGVSDGGKLAYSRGYGQADLEWRQPITPETIFDAGSVAKQFTAFAVVLLESRGKLRLDDDIRKHLPELPAFAQTVTLHHLLEQTSGLPDYPTLGLTTGRIGVEGLDREIALDLVKRIKGLDFVPGSDWSYSNTNYLLLGLIAERVSGVPLGKFLETEAFGPLGMKQTLYSPDPKRPVMGRAESYARAESGFLKSPAPAAEGGAKGIQTNVVDLLKWAGGLDGGVLGGKTIARRMTTARSLSSGEPLVYAVGLRVAPYRGTPTVRHSGEFAAYTTELLRLPSMNLAIAVMCNRSDVLAETLAEKVADAWLGERLAPRPAVAPIGEVHRAAAGHYINQWGQTVELAIDGENMTARPLAREPIAATGPRAFSFGRSVQSAQIRIGEGTAPRSIVVTRAGQQPVTYTRFTPAAPAPEALEAYAGRYISDDFGSLIEFEAADGQLHVMPPAGKPQKLRATTADRFALGAAGLTFERGAKGEVQRLIVSQPRARRIVFTRVSGSP